jgi:hypothetical protein
MLFYDTLLELLYDAGLLEEDDTLKKSKSRLSDSKMNDVGLCRGGGVSFLFVVFAVQLLKR